MVPAASRDDAVRILLIEDSPADAELLVGMLTGELPAATVTVVSCLDAARQLIGRGVDVDVVITELRVPAAAGLRAVEVLREALPGTPVLVMAEGCDSDTRAAALCAGADDYLVKGTHDARSVATSLLYAVQRRRVEGDSRRFERLALSLLDAMEAPTCAVDEQARLVAVNRAWHDFAAGVSGVARPVALGSSYVEFCRNVPEPMPAAEAALRRLLSGEVQRVELDQPCRLGEELRWFSIRMNPLPDGTGAVLTHVDVSAARRAQQALAHSALHDALTDLPNRSLLDDRLLQSLAAAARRGHQVGVAFVDVDQFKRINDSLGHAAGDELLVAVANRLADGLAGDETLARFAGDEFVAVWPDVHDAAEVELRAERLRAAFDAPFVLRAATVAVTASIGVALGAAPLTPDEILLAADAAMHDAKSRGRGRTRMYTSELRDGAEQSLRTEAELRAALSAGSFELHYQPVVDLRSRSVRGVEALVRWRHEGGLRMPDSFIPVAESTGLIVPLGLWVLEEACRQAAVWKASGLELDMAVNLSVRQVSHPHVVDAIRDALQRHRLDPRRLLLEVTESAVLEDAEAAQLALEQIAALGASIAIDDFGTGYSSLLYLKRYPIHALKIDRSFVAGMGENEDDDAIVASVISLARAVGAVCIAEGVETSAQHQALLALRCDQAQGYLFGRPVPAAELPAALAVCLPLLQAEPVPSAAARPAPKVDRSVLARIEELRADGASAHTIAAALNRERLPNPLGVRWHRTTVAQVVAGCMRAAPRPRVTPEAPARRPAQAPEVGIAEGPDAAERVTEGLHLQLAASDAVLVVATPESRALLEAGLVRRGHDLTALAQSGAYTALDAATTLSRLTIDGYLSARLFREVVTDVVAAKVAAHRSVEAYGEMVSLLREQGQDANALALEGLWKQLCTRLACRVTFGPRAGLLRSGAPEQRHLVHAQSELRAP
jgi:diguanylate cyclase (GGDEF)-like protein